MADDIERLFERMAQLDALRAWWDEAQASTGRLVLLAGEAGAGKTALINRFRTDLDPKPQVLWGNCEPLTTPAVLGPVLDMAPLLPPEVASLAASDPVQFRRAFLDATIGCPSGALIVIEDAHWADEATLDLIQFLGRRIHPYRVMLVVTYRSDEVGTHHPLRVLAGDLASLPVVRRLDVPLLSLDAVAELTAGTDVDAVDLHRRTAGNPFYVTEVLAAGGALAAGVRDAVLARAARLTPAARETLEAAACLGYRAPASLIEMIAEHDSPALDECVSAGMLVASDGELAFRHELARVAIEATVPPGRTRTYNSRALSALEKLDADDVDPGRLAQHAERSGDSDALLHWSHIAAMRAAQLGAHREAVAHFRRVLTVAQHLSVSERAELTEGLAMQCLLSDQTDRAIEAWRAAAELWRDAGYPDRQSGALVGLAHTTMLSARWAHTAEAICDEAIDVLTGEPPGPALAVAYSNRAKFAALGHRGAEAVEWAERALAIAPPGEASLARVYGLMLAGAGRAQQGDERGLAELEEAVRSARAGGWRDETGLAYFWLYFVAVVDRRYPFADRWYDDALGYVTDHDQETWREWLRAFHSRALLDRGQWDEAERLAADVHRRAPVEDGRKMTAMVTLGRLAARRGDPDAALLLEEVRDVMKSAQPVVGWCINSNGAIAEAAWIRGEQDTIAGLLAEPYRLAQSVGDPWWLGELAYWLDRAGALPQPPHGMARPYALQLDGRPLQAAEAWTALGCPYEAARSLLDADDEPSLRSALDTFDRLGARPARDEAAAKLRRFGVRSVPRPKRPRQASGDPLSSREAQVLAHLADGQRNAEIAAQLFLSERTVEHHVASILRKLGARDRAEAGRLARRRGIDLRAAEPG